MKTNNIKENITSYIIVGILFLILGFGISHATMMIMHHGKMMNHSLGDNNYKKDTMNHSQMGHTIDMKNEMNHNPMDMSMADMGAMLEGKAGDELDKAFLEGMIPHHQGAIDMAEYLVNAKHPELQELGTEIIKAQQGEIEQMQTWLQEWGYSE